MNTIDTVRRPVMSPIRRIATTLALCALVATLTATWLTSAPAAAGPSSPPAPAVAATGGKPAEAPAKAKKKGAPTGKLNLNTATTEQLELLPGVGPAKAERVVAWRKKHGGFKRVEDLRKVKGFGYKTLKKLAPYLDVKGETTLR